MTRRRDRWQASLVALALVGAVAFGPVRPAAAATDQWDPRIVDLVKEVEQLRGLQFEHPVPVDVLGDQAFEKRFLRGQKPTRRDRVEWDQTQDAFIAMGLQDKRISLDEVQSASGTNVAGFYDPDRKAIVVRGSKFSDVSTRTTLVHELTHALQDQHFDIEALQKRASKADSMFTRALIEGDATEVEQRYYASLSPGDQDAASQSVDEALAEATPLPPFLEAMFYAPYSFGVEVARTLRALGGRTRLDAVMSKPPTRDLGLLDPTALEGPEEWVSVRAPALDKGDVKQGDAFPMDAIGIYLVLAERLAWDDALAVSERWGGDQTVTFERGSQPCVRMRIAGRHGVDDAVAIGDAFRRWATFGGTDTDVVQDGRYAQVTLCDPVDHQGAPAPTAPAQAVLGSSIRNDLVAQLVGGGASLTVAKCTADKLVQLPEMDPVVTSVQSLNDDIPDTLSADLRSAIGGNVVKFEAQCQRSG